MVGLPGGPAGPREPCPAEIKEKNHSSINHQVFRKYSNVGTDHLRSTVSERISGHQLTILPPWTEIKGRDVLALGVTGPSRPVLEGFFWYLSDTSVVADDAGK